MPSRGKDRRPTPVVPIERAFDELRFGTERTLNLRDSLPTVLEATTRLESWLRMSQAQGWREVLVITGRGLGSLDGVGRVRAAVSRQCTALKRHNIVDTVLEHGPGAFVVTLQPLRAMVEAPRLRKHHVPAPPVAAPIELSALQPETLAVLRRLAELVVERLGIREASVGMVEDEMRAQFATMTRAVQGAEDLEAALRDLAGRTIEELLFEE
jgi:hypothetical protein